MKKNTRDYFGLREKSLLQREINYLNRGMIPYNAVIVDRDNNCYIGGICDSISSHFSLSRRSVVWGLDGSSYIFSLLSIKSLPLDIINTKIPDSNFVYCVEGSDFLPLKDILVTNPYQGKSKGVCLGFMYDKSCLYNVIFLPPSIYQKITKRYSGSVIDIYSDLYTLYNSSEGIEKGILSLVLKKLEKTSKVNTIIERGGTFDFSFLEKLYDADKETLHDLLYTGVKNLSLKDNLYGCDILKKLKLKNIKTNLKNSDLSELVKLKRELRFSGGVLCPNEIVNPSISLDFYTDNEKGVIEKNLSSISMIKTQKQLLEVLNYFDRKMLEPAVLKHYLTIVFNKIEYNKDYKLMLLKLLEDEPAFNSITHAIYGGNLYNIIDMDTDKNEQFIRSSLRKDGLKKIKKFKILNFKNNRDMLEKAYMLRISQGFYSLEEKLENKQYTKFDLYNAVISNFELDFLEIKNGIISFDVKDKRLLEFLNFILLDLEVLDDVLFGKSFGYIKEKGLYRQKLMKEKKLYNFLKNSK